MTPTSTHSLKYKSKNNMGKMSGDAVVLAKGQSEHNLIQKSDHGNHWCGVTTAVFLDYRYTFRALNPQAP